MCGSGRLLVPLLAAGRKVHGVDPSAEAIELCEERLAAAKISTTLLRQDPSTLNAPFRYGAAICAAGVFQRITHPAKVRSALTRVVAHLIEPAILLMTLSIPSERMRKLAAPLVEIDTARLDDGTQINVRSETTVIADAQIATVLRRYVRRRGSTRIAEESESIRTTWYSRDDLSALLHDVGFSNVAIEPGPVPIAEEDTYAVVARL